MSKEAKAFLGSSLPSPYWSPGRALAHGVDGGMGGKKKGMTRPPREGMSSPVRAGCGIVPEETEREENEWREREEKFALYDISRNNM